MTKTTFLNLKSATVKTSTSVLPPKTSSEASSNASKTLGQKNDTAKARWDLLPLPAISQIVDVLTFGAKKYADNNWQHVQQPKDRYFAAALRHIVAWREGESKDPESGLHHLAHASCCLIFLLWFDRNE